MQTSSHRQSGHHTRVLYPTSRVSITTPTLSHNTRHVYSLLPQKQKVVPVSYRSAIESERPVRQHLSASVSHRTRSITTSTLNRLPDPNEHAELYQAMDTEFSGLQHETYTTYSTSQTIRSHLHVQSQLRALFPKEVYSPIESSLSSYKQYTLKLPKTPGLFGTCGVASPNSLYLLIKDKTELIKSRAFHLLSNPTSTNSLQYLDDMSKLLCDVADLIGVIKNIHTDPNMRETAHKLSIESQKLLGEWSSSPIVLLSLYNMLRTQAIWDQLTIEGRRIILDLLGRMSFQARYNHISMACLYLRSEAEHVFTSDLDQNPKWIQLELPASQLTHHDTKIIDKHPHVLSINRRGYVCFRNDPYYADLLLQTVTTPDFRRLIYNIKDQPYQERLKTLEEVLKYRHLGSLALGNPSYGHETAASLLSKTPEIPVKLLTSFSDSIKHARLNEYKLMKAVLSHYERDENISASGRHQVTGVDEEYQVKPLSPFNTVSESILGYFKDRSKFEADPDQLYPWDIPFATSLVNSVSNIKMEEITDYLRLDYVLQGFGLICNVMNVKAELHCIRPGEGWSGHNRTAGVEIASVYETYRDQADINNSTYHYAVHTLREEGTWCALEDLPKRPEMLESSVIKFHISDKTTNTLLGVLYLDLYQNSSKFAGNCQFVISSGRVSHDNISSPSLTYDEILKEHQAQLESVDSSKQEIDLPSAVLQKYDLPISLLSTQIQDRGKARGSLDNDMSPRRSSQQQILPKLKYDELQTLFHELGHSLHTILSRTQFQHFAGSRCEMDFVELPSTLFELLVEDPSFLRLFARHYETGQQLPEDICEAVNVHSNLFPAYQMTQSVVSSLIDLRFHMPPSPYDPMSIYPSMSQQYTHASSSAASVLDTIHTDDAIRSFAHAHAAPHQTTQIAHSIYRRYADIDITEDGFGVYLDGYTLSSPYNIPKKSQVLPHASDHHLVHYGGFYFSYVYCKAFAMLVKRFMFDDLLSVNTTSSKTSRPPRVMSTSKHDKDVNFIGGRSVDQRNQQQEYHLQRMKAHIDDISSHIGTIRGVDSDDASITTSRAVPTTSSFSQQEIPTGITTLANTDSFDQVFPTTESGLLFRKLVLEKGGSQNGLEILADLLDIPGDKQTLAFPVHLFDEQGELLPSYLTTEQRERREQLTRKREIRRNSDIRLDNTMKDPVNVDKTYALPPIYQKDMNILTQSITLALKEIGWKNTQLTGRQQQVLSYAFHNLTETIEEQSKAGILFVQRKLGVAGATLKELQLDGRSPSPQVY